MNEFMIKSWNKFGYYKFYCYICIVKVLKNDIKIFQKKVEINLEVLIFIVIFVLWKVLKNDIKNISKKVEINLEVSKKVVIFVSWK